ncbi:integrase core domain-containing protein, partial [Burkholderia cenocepacia]|uniref:integrase core domain-containing protein n=1 Tax=Burkholderia cenocepacia TaxID=95486 RepID=UPI00215B434E
PKRWCARRVHRSSACQLIHPLCASPHATPPRLKVLRRPVEFAQYVSIRYSERLAEAGIEPSVGSRGDSYDNALAETINGVYKAELIHRRAPSKTRESVELATLEWVAWYNHHRLMEPLGYIPPAEAEANYYGQLRNAADVSALT